MKIKWSQYYQEYEKEVYESLLVTYKELKQQYDYESIEFFFNKLADHLIDLKRRHSKFSVDEKGRQYHCNYKKDLIDKFQTFKLGFKNDKEIEGFYKRFVSDIMQVHLKKIKNLPSELVKGEYSDATFLDKATKPDIIEFLIKYEVLDSFLYDEKIKNLIRNLDPLEVIKSHLKENSFNDMSIEEIYAYFSILMLPKKSDNTPILKQEDLNELIIRICKCQEPAACEPILLNLPKKHYPRLKRFFYDFYDLGYKKEGNKTSLLKEKYIPLMYHLAPFHNQPFTPTQIYNFSRLDEERTLKKILKT